MTSFDSIVPQNVK